MVLDTIYRNKKVLLFCIILHLIISFTQLSFGITYAIRDSSCPGIPSLFYYFIGGGLTELILLLSIIALFYFKHQHRFDRVPTTTETNEERDQLPCQNCLYISLCVIFLMTVVFFVLAHQVFHRANQIQFINRSEQTFCEPILFYIDVSLIIATYCFIVMLVVLSCRLYIANHPIFEE